MFLNNEQDSRLITAWNCMTHLVTTRVVLTQNVIPLKRFISVVNVISSIPSYSISKIRLIRRIFARNEQILQKEALFCPAKRMFVFKIYFYISFINMCSQGRSLKYINFHFNNLNQITQVPELVESDMECIRKMNFFSY